MSAILGSFKEFFTGVKYKKIYVDNIVFRFHYKVTGLICLIFGILVAERMYIGDPIDCMTQHKDADKIMDQFCWVHGTYTRLEITQNNQPAYGKQKTQQDNVATVQQMAKEGSFKKQPSTEIAREFFNYKGGTVDSREYHTYYQWVWVFFLIEAILFYFPHWLWKTWEGGRMRTFVADLNSFWLSDDDKRKYQASVCEYFCNQGKGQWSLGCWKPRGNHTVYALKYFFCELLNFGHLVAQMYWIDAFFLNGFSKYGLKLWKVTDTRAYARNDYMTAIFPFITMCELPVIGYTGDIAPVQAVCVLPVNVLNEKIFIIIWSWFIYILLPLTTLGIIYRIVTIFPLIPIRKWLLLRLNHSMNAKSVEALCRQLDFGDWFFLYLLGKNMNPIYYAELITALGERFEPEEPTTYGASPPIEGWGTEFKKEFSV